MINYKKIAKFIKDARTLYIWNTEDLQYVCNGIAVYPIFGMPKMSPSEVLTFLGLADKKKDIMTIDNDAPEWLKNATYDKLGEGLLGRTGPDILLNGEVCRIFYTERGAVIVKSAYLSVAELSATDETPLIHCLLKMTKGTAVATFVGFELYNITMTIPPNALAAQYEVLASQIATAERIKMSGSEEKK